MHRTLAPDPFVRSCAQSAQWGFADTDTGSGSKECAVTDAAKRLAALGGADPSTSLRAGCARPYII
jgi:hypothetical protein